MRFGRILELGLSGRVPESEKNSSKGHDRSEPNPYDWEAESKAVLQQYLERRVKERLEREFADLEKTLDRALSDSPPEEAYRGSFIKPLLGDSWAYMRLTDLAVALDLMKKFRENLPERYQANINKVRERAEEIKKIFQEYRELREKGEASKLHDAAALLSAIETLRKIDPDQFPLELVDVSQRDRDRLVTMSDFAVRRDEHDEPQVDSVTPSH